MGTSHALGVVLPLVAMVACSAQEPSRSTSGEGASGGAVSTNAATGPGGAGGAFMTATSGGGTTATQAASSGAGGATGGCGLNPQDPSKYVLVGFWKSSDCSGDPVKINPFPVEGSAPCYCWPGNSGQNSADGFTCDVQAKTFTYIQYNSLTCGAGDNTPTSKTVSETCKQDIPPTIYAKIVDFGACAAP